VDSEWYDCEGNLKGSLKVPPLLEAWEVSGGRIGRSLVSTDTFSSADRGNCTKGYLNITGKIVFAKEYVIVPSEWPGVAMPGLNANSLSRWVPPALPSTDKAKDHWLKLKWDCTITPHKEPEVTACPN